MYDPQSTQNYRGNVNKLLHSINCRYIGNGIGLPVRNLNNCKDMLNMFCLVSKLYCYTAVKKGGVPFQKSFFFFFFELLLPLCNAVSELWRWIMVSISWCHRGVDLWPFGYKMTLLHHFILSDVLCEKFWLCPTTCFVKLLWPLTARSLSLHPCVHACSVWSLKKFPLKIPRSQNLDRQMDNLKQCLQPRLWTVWRHTSVVWSLLASSSPSGQ